jgi:hypothetical protein
MMDGQLRITEPRARRTDPSTSHEAARSVRNIEKVRTYILRAYDTMGPMTDRKLCEWFMLNGPTHTPFSESGIRTRRSELERDGLVEYAGWKNRLPSGRMARVYRLKQDERCPTCGCPDPRHLNHGRHPNQGPCPDPFHKRAA